MTRRKPRREAERGGDKETEGQSRDPAPSIEHLVSRIPHSASINTEGPRPMHNLLLAVQGINDFWYALPLVIALSLVYSATRHEQMMPILVHAARVGLWIVGFMAAIFVVLWLIS